MYQPAEISALAFAQVDSHIQGIKSEISVQRARSSPADDLSVEHVGDECDVDPAGERVDIGVGSASSALPVFELVGFCWPPSEPDVPIPEHPALHVIMPRRSSMVWECGFLDTGSGPR